MSEEREFADGELSDKRRTERRKNSPVSSLSQEALADLISDAVGQKHSACLTDDEARWVRMAIQAEAKKAIWRDAVIKHTTLALLGLFAVWVATHAFDALVWAVDYFRTNPPKPPMVK